VASVLLLGAPGYVVTSLIDRAERRGTRKWILAVAYGVVGVGALVAGYLPGGDPNMEVHPSELGWMGYGIAGGAAFIGLWLASIPFRDSRVGAYLRVGAVASGLAPIAAHLLGWI
jgi:hypothetical protein